MSHQLQHDHRAESPSGYDRLYWDDKIVFISGAGSGIGRATAKLFAKYGAQTILAGRTRSSLEGVAEEITNIGGKPSLILSGCDISQESCVATAFKEVEERFGHLDAAANMAGVETPQVELLDSKAEQWHQIIETNLSGTFFCLQYQIPLMRKTGRGGAIVNASSVAGLMGLKGLGAYCASKWGLIGLSKSAALDYAKDNIRINVIAPGVVKTPMIDRMMGDTPEARDYLIHYEPIGRLATSEEIAANVFHLCTPEASFMTGAVVPVDGGMSTGLI